MWCANCQSDVAAEVTAENRHVRCATCGSTLNSMQAIRSGARTQEARELLERWANHQLFDPFGPVPGHRATSDRPASERAKPQPPTAAGSPLESAARPEAGKPRKPKFRVDRPHPEFDRQDEDEPRIAAQGLDLTKLDDPTPSGEETFASRKSAGGDGDDDDREGDVPQPERTPRSGPPAGGSPAAVPPRDRARRSVVTGRHSLDRSPTSSTVASLSSHSPLRNLTQTQLRVDQPQSAARGPHFDLQAIIPTEAPPKTNWGALVGQLLAYAGVAGLTVGTTLVLWGYFGGPENYTPTGWLITTAGQMLLFLGVITLISGGMEQTTEEVARRIDTLGDKILRIERASHDHALRGPKTPVERFANSTPDEPQADSNLRQELTELSRQLARYRSSSL